MTWANAALPLGLAVNDVLIVLASRNPDWWANKMWQARAERRHFGPRLLPMVELMGD